MDESKRHVVHKKSFISSFFSSVYTLFRKSFSEFSFGYLFGFVWLFGADVLSLVWRKKAAEVVVE